MRACSVGYAANQSGTGYEPTVVVRMEGTAMRIRIAAKQCDGPSAYGSATLSGMKPKTSYLAFCVLGVLLPYWQLLPWVYENGLQLNLLVRDLFANRIGAFFGMDVIVSAFVLLVFI